MSSPVESQMVKGTAAQTVVARDPGANNGSKLSDQIGSREAAVDLNNRQIDVSTS